MALSAFDDAENVPADADLSEVLGRSKVQWDALRAHASEVYSPLTEKWQFGGAKWGWTLRLIQKKRTILYMTPGKKHFLVGFALGEKAVRAARQAGLPPDILAIIDAAPKYAEGRGVRIEVRTKKQRESVEKLAAAKMTT